MKLQTFAGALTDLLNPFFVFSALYAAVAFTRSEPSRAPLFVGLELLAAAFVAGYVLLMRRRRRVGDFWIASRAERLAPALVLLATFAALLVALPLLGAPSALFRASLSMGLASALVAAATLRWKASAHSAVAGHAAAAGLVLLGPAGLPFLVAFPLVVWARVSSGAHTTFQTLAGGAAGAALALLFLL